MTEERTLTEQDLDDVITAPECTCAKCKATRALIVNVILNGPQPGELRICKMPAMDTLTYFDVSHCDAREMIAKTHFLTGHYGFYIANFRAIFAARLATDSEFGAH